MASDADRQGRVVDSESCPGRVVEGESSHPSFSKKQLLAYERSVVLILLYQTAVERFPRIARNNFSVGYQMAGAFLDKQI